MVIVYQSKTGFTKKYAEMLAAMTKLKIFPVSEISKVKQEEEIIFLGWMKAGKIQGLDKIRKYKIKAVCASGTGRSAEPNTETVISRNKIEGLPFFYLRGGCRPLKELKGIDKFLMTLFVKMLKGSKNKDSGTKEAITSIENGCDFVKQENLKPVVEWLKTR